MFLDKDGFLVYFNKFLGLFFYYNVVLILGMNGKFLVFGFKIIEIFGLVGCLLDDFDLSLWLFFGLLNKKDLFSDVVRYWLYYFLF